jgi:hypothetical protein
VQQFKNHFSNLGGGFQVLASTIRWRRDVRNSMDSEFDALIKMLKLLLFHCVGDASYQKSTLISDSL